MSPVNSFKRKADRNEALTTTNRPNPVNRVVQVNPERNSHHSSDTNTMAGAVYQVYITCFVPSPALWIQM